MPFQEGKLRQSCHCSTETGLYMMCVSDVLGPLNLASETNLARCELYVVKFDHTQIQTPIDHLPCK